MLVPILRLLSLTLFLLLTLFILRRPGLGLRIRLARIPHALSRWRAQIKSKYKKALQRFSLQRSSLESPSLERHSLGPLSLGPLSAQNVAKLEDAGRAGYHNPFDSSPSPSLRDGDCSSYSSSEGLSPSPSSSSIPPPPLHPATSPRPSRSTSPISLRTAITATPQPLPLPPQLPYLDPCQPQRIIKQAPQRQSKEPSGAYDTLIPLHHSNDSKTGPRTLSPAIESRSPVPSPLSWDTQLDKYFYANGVGIRDE